MGHYSNRCDGQNCGYEGHISFEGYCARCQRERDETKARVEAEQREQSGPQPYGLEEMR